MIQILRIVVLLMIVFHHSSAMLDQLLSFNCNYNLTSLTCFSDRRRFDLMFPSKDRAGSFLGQPCALSGVQNISIILVLRKNTGVLAARLELESKTKKCIRVPAKPAPGQPPARPLNSLQPLTRSLSSCSCILLYVSWLLSCICCRYSWPALRHSCCPILSRLGERVAGAVCFHSTHVFIPKYNSLVIADYLIPNLFFFLVLFVF
jgi:hypothetical protein